MNSCVYFQNFLGKTFLTKTDRFFTAFPLPLVIVLAGLFSLCWSLERFIYLKIYTLYIYILDCFIYLKICTFHIWHFDIHCVKSVQIRCFLWSVLSRIWTEYGEIRSISLRIQSEYGKIRTRKNSVFGNFSRSDYRRDYIMIS